MLTRDFQVNVRRRKYQPDLILGLLVLMAMGCSAGADKVNNVDQIHNVAFSTSTGHLVPAKLQDPERWVFAAKEEVPGKFLRWTWHKLANKDPNQWTESFQYEDYPRPPMTSQQFLAYTTEHYSKLCPSGILTPAAVNDTELMVEMKSGGCGKFGPQDELDRWMFGKHDLFHVVYIVKSAEMTSVQRDQGMAAVKAFGSLEQAPF